MKKSLYPNSPKLEDRSFLNPSSEFKKTALLVIFSIILFVLFYFLLVAIAGGLMYLTIWSGITVIAFRPSFLTLAVGLGLIGLGVMFFLFLIKFVFSSSKNENPSRVELKAKDHPELFDFIRQLTKDTQTPFPKKIFVSPEVNAMVFYNSSFWSMFFPVRKNLEIGLGLVNTLSVSEFKSVLAHEFGHFSQRSMKIGSYIYRVNRAIHNMVFEYDNWDKSLNGWASAGGILGFFAIITFYLVEGVRKLLNFAYQLININYMKLSREMEYHADLVAVSVSGNNAFKNALRKIEFSSYAYDFTTNHLSQLAEKKQSFPNLYEAHFLGIKKISQINQIGEVTDQLNLSDEDLLKLKADSRVNVKNLWASHPSLREREESIARVNIISEEENASAWTLFSDAEQLQHNITSKIYLLTYPDRDFTPATVSELEQHINQSVAQYKISDRFNGFYDNRWLSTIDTNSGDFDRISQLTFEDLFTIEKVQKLKKLSQNQADLNVLNEINLKQIPVKKFEFDGKQYKQREATPLVLLMKKEIENLQKEVIEMDQEAFQFFKKVARQQGVANKLSQKYENHLDYKKAHQEFEAFGTKYHNFLNRLYSIRQWTEDLVSQYAREVSNLEGEWKTLIRNRDINELLAMLPNEQSREVLSVYMKEEKYYTKMNQLDGESIMHLTNLIHLVVGAISDKCSLSLKELTDFQLKIVDEVPAEA